MIKLIHLITRREDLTPEQFEHHWLNVHGPLVKRHAEKLKIRRVVQVHAGSCEVAGATSDPRGSGAGTAVEYDGAAEAWWDSAEDFLASQETEDGKAAWAEIAADEPNFVNSKVSYVYIGEEIEIFPGS